MSGVATALLPLPQVTGFPTVNTFAINSISMPGKWTLVSATKKWGWQIQKGNALNYATIWPTGQELIEAKFKGEIWNNSDVILFNGIRKTLLNQSMVVIGIPGAQGGVASAFAIDHPELKALGCISAVMSEMSPLIQSEGGMWTIDMSFIQWNMPKPAPPKPKQAIPPVGPTIGAKTAAETVTANLKAQKDALQGALAKGA